MMETQKENETPKEIKSDVLLLCTKAERTLTLIKAFKINSDDDYTLAAGQLKKIKDQSRELTDERMGITRPMDESKSKIIAHFGGPLNFLSQAEGLIKKGMIEYDDLKEKERLEEQKRLDDEAEKLRIEEEKKAAAELEKNPPPPAEEGKNDMAVEVVPDPMAQVVVPVKSNIASPKVAGVSKAVTWYAEITDPKEIIKGVAAGTIPMAAITINESFFNTQARTLKGEFNYPGAVAKNKKSIRA